MTLEKVNYWEAVAEAGWKLAHHALWRDHSDAVNLALLARWLPAGRARCLLKTDVFDEAVGIGLYPTLVSRAKRVVSMDISGSTLQPARTRYRGMRAVKADVRCLPFADNSFDVVVSNSTLDHFTSGDQIVESLRELSRTLRPGGQLLLTMDNLANPVVRVRNALPFHWLNRLGLVPYYVGATCGSRRLRRYVEQAGLDVLETTAILHCPRVFVVALARYLNGRVGERIQRNFLRWIMAFERLERWPTRYFTGYFVAVRAAKRKPAVPVGG